MANEMVTFKDNNGEVVKLTPSIIRNYISNNKDITDGEVVMFMELCKFRKLNPFLREAYLIKYGNSPAQQIVAAIAMNKIAKANPNYAGEKSGVTVIKENGAVERRRGELILPTEQLVGAWCEVYIKGYVEPIFEEVSLSDYDKKVSLWKTMPAVMLHKVACAKAWRTAFPNDFSGVYTAEEMPVDVAKLPTHEIDATEITDAPIEFINQSFFTALSKLWGTDKWKQIKAVEVMNKFGIPAPYKAIDVRLYDEIYAEIKEATTPVEIKAVEVVPVKPDYMADIEGDFPDSYEPDMPMEEYSPVKDSLTTAVRPNADMTITFGKHKGKRLDEVEDGYLRWLLEQPIKDDNFKASNVARNKKIQAYLDGKPTATADDDIPLPFDL